MSDKPYYLAYESRYQKVFEAGVERWGHSPDDVVLVETLTKWVQDNNLKDKHIIEFACGEGACGVILSKLGCRYLGVDISPIAVEKSKEALKEYPNAKVLLLDMVNENVNDVFDAGLDVMGLHMLVLDSDRKKYLRNAFHSLRNNAPMLFFHESYRSNAPEVKVDTFEEWKAITGDDYDTPQKRVAKGNGDDIEVYIPLLPARAKSKEGYLNEFSEAGFIVDDFVEMDMNQQCTYSASLFIHKP